MACLEMEPLSRKAVVTNHPKRSLGSKSEGGMIFQILGEKKKKRTAGKAWFVK